MEVKNNTGSATPHEPKALRECLDETLHSDLPLGRSFRKHRASVYPNTETGVDLKIRSCTPGRMTSGRAKKGWLTRDGEDHYTFTEI